MVCQEHFSLSEAMSHVYHGITVCCWSFPGDRNWYKEIFFPTIYEKRKTYQLERKQYMDTLDLLEKIKSSKNLQMLTKNLFKFVKANDFLL